MKPSILDAALPAFVPEPAVGPVLARLESLGIVGRMAHVPAIEGSLWEIEADLDGRPLRVFCRGTETEMFGLHVELGRLERVDADAALASRRSLGVALHLDPEDPLGTYHDQLVLLDVLAPEAVALIDVSAATVRPGRWLREAASSSVPPHPEYLYTIHALHDDTEAWLHTHGLHRCGRSEMDMMKVPRGDAGKVAMLLNAAAQRALDGDLPERGEPFEPGMGMPLVWYPVDEALDYAKGAVQGVRADRDPLHRDDRIVLFVPPRKTWLSWLTGVHHESPAIYAPLFDDNPLLYLSTLNTARMAALAEERLPRFRALRDRTLGSPLFAYLVKLGLETSDGGREHLWFELDKIDDTHVSGRCLNQPYDVPGLHEGQSRTLPLELLSDFAVLCPLGNLSPERLQEAELLASDPARMQRYEEKLGL